MTFSAKSEQRIVSLKTVRATSSEIMFGIVTVFISIWSNVLSTLACCRFLRGDTTVPLVGRANKLASERLAAAKPRLRASYLRLMLAPKRLVIETRGFTVVVVLVVVVVAGAVVVAGELGILSSSSLERIGTVINLRWCSAWRALKASARVTSSSVRFLFCVETYPGQYKQKAKNTQRKRVPTVSRHFRYCFHFQSIQPCMRQNITF